MVAGRPKKPIDWNKVDELMEVNSPASEIIDHFDVNLDTFYRRFKEHYECNFQDYKLKYHSIGKASLRRSQYDKALEGNTQMLILLGKLWLGQVDIEPEPKKTNDFNAENELMKKDHIIEEQQALLKLHNIEFNAIQNESETE